MFDTWTRQLGLVLRIFLSPAWSLQFGMNNKNLEEAWQGISSFLGAVRKPTTSHTVPVVLSHVGAGREISSFLSNNLKLCMQLDETVWIRPESCTMCFLFRKIYFISPVKLSDSLWPCNLINFVAGCGIISFSSVVLHAYPLTKGQGWMWVSKVT